MTKTTQSGLNASGLTGQNDDASEPGLTFKDVMAADVKDAFIFGGEFAEEHEVGGMKMLAILDDVEQVEREKRYKANAAGIFAKQIFLYVKARDLPGGMPARGSSLTVDGEVYLVSETTSEDGILAITLEANRSTRRR